MSREIDVDLTLTEPQEDFVFSEAQFPAFVGGFGAGKSDALVTRLLIQKLAYPALDVGYFAPTYDLIRLIAWPKFQKYLQAWGIRHKLNKSDRQLHLSTGGSIIFRTLDNPDNIIGFEIADAGIDEFDTLDEAKAQNAWNKVIARCRSRKPDGLKNTACIATTPEGFRFVYQTWGKKKPPGYELYRAPTSSNPFLPDDYVEQLRAIYPPALLAAYLEGQFVNLNSGAVYPDFDRTLNYTDAVIEPGEPLHIGMDFNVRNCTAIVFVIRDNQPHAVDELTGIRDTPAMCEAITEKFQDHKIHVYPDASGKSNRSVNASESDLTILRAAGFFVRVDESNPLIKDRVTTVNALILNGEGERRLLVNTDRCPVLTECLEQQVYDDNGLPDKKDGKDHAPDAAGYFLHKRWPVIKPALDYSKLLRM